ncbi:MotA/TolQ/ExbB proton channel family protein [Helicobacter sp. MIT 14-3879]|uniref:MotA/TolQ/ExbB proton channel family protein n=1 Tax=Helicobacter sp. MIT 14-3879 TaxID=2040649 RepID=UPI000E1EF5E8|nr:MotA/TolQ/ExbB proton channel family protein [Helicobacter sp. MIT 14-3879]RDU63169.1 MotA/TolQ/ExbB proton channel family protein [Helicobacter sp. MIT 14-3879]
MSDFLSDIGPITWLVLVWLSVYFIINIWIFIWRFLKISDNVSIERDALELIANSHTPMLKSIFYKILTSNKISSIDLLNAYKIEAIKKASIGLSMLSIISSTAPFIGLFGTVVEILEAFYHLGGEGKVSFDIIAPIISKALIATAFGILTAIPAYSFYIILRRKVYELGAYLDMQINFILNSNKDDSKIKLTQS